MPGKLKSPLLGTLKWGNFSFPGMAACKVGVPLHFKHKSGGFTLAWPSCSSCCQVLVYLTSGSNKIVHVPMAIFQRNIYATELFCECSAVVTPVVVLYFATTNPITAPWGFPGFVKHWFNFSKIQFLHFWKLKLPQEKLWNEIMLLDELVRLFPSISTVLL